MITIYGASDDLVEVDGCEGADEFDIGVDGTRWQGDLVGLDVSDQMRVWCWYDKDGTWQVGVGQTTELVTMASWPVAITQHQDGYSAMLSIDAPEGTRLVNVKPAAGA